MSALWLVRRDKFTILGPYDSRTIEDLLSSGGLSSLDELCKGDDDWFILKDQVKVQKYFHGLKIHDHSKVEASFLGETRTFDITKLDLDSADSRVEEPRKDRLPPRVDRMSGRRTIHKVLFYGIIPVLILLGMTFLYFFR